MLEETTEFNLQELLKGAKPFLAYAQTTFRLIREKAYELANRGYSELAHQVAGEDYI